MTEKKQNETSALTRTLVRLQAFFHSCLHLRAEKFRFDKASCSGRTEAKGNKRFISFLASFWLLATL